MAPLGIVVPPVVVGLVAPLSCAGFPPVAAGFPPVAAGLPPVAAGFPPVAAGFPPVMPPASQSVSQSLTYSQY